MKNTLFFDEEAAIQELQNRGYRVIKEEIRDCPKLSTIPELVTFFYARRRFYNPERKFPESIDYENDRKYVSNLVKARQETGINRKTAIQEAAKLIDALFKYEDLLNLDYPIAGANILGSHGLMNRVCSFLNGEIPEAGEIDSDRAIDSWNAYYNKHNADEDRRIAKEKMQRALEKINEQKRK